MEDVWGVESIPSAGSSLDINIDGRTELIKNKQASGREQDLLDARKLERH